MSILVMGLFRSKEDKRLYKQLKNILGFRPGNLTLYRTALSHRSIREGADENNERLEYLGDAILGAIVAHYLFMMYPYKDEGFLTEMRSKMVNRRQLNSIATKIGLNNMTIFNKTDGTLKGSQIFGNTLEAVVGAVFLDRGYRQADRWVIRRVINPYLFLDELENMDINLKNKLYGWVSKKGKTLEFETLSERMEGNRRLFTVGAMIDRRLISKGVAFNKKAASQMAAEKAIEILNIE